MLVSSCNTSNQCKTVMSHFKEQKVKLPAKSHNVEMNAEDFRLLTLIGFLDKNPTDQLKSDLCLLCARTIYLSEGFNFSDTLMMTKEKVIFNITSRKGCNYNLSERISSNVGQNKTRGLCSIRTELSDLLKDSGVQSDSGLPIHRSYVDHDPTEDRSVSIHILFAV